MVLVKSQKSRGYFERYQVKFRRRRCGKTDYRARIRLINQDKNKYGTPKYRFVVQFTNKDIVAQIVSATIAVDMILISAYANELPRCRLHVGLTNYAAAYCTGLLLARRVIKTLEMDEEMREILRQLVKIFQLSQQIPGGPFRALLDMGLIQTTTGNRVFGSLKEALDGGSGFKNEDKQLDIEVHHKYVYGVHVAQYMKTLIEDSHRSTSLSFLCISRKELSLK